MLCDLSGWSRELPAREAASCYPCTSGGKAGGTAIDHTARCAGCHHQAAMASYEKSGLVAFPVDGAPRSFRFSVSAADSKLRIWIEDCVSKEQWQTKTLALEEFVTLETAIPQAKAKDYAVRVVECLVPTDESEEVTRSLSRPASDGSRVLCIGFTLQMGTFSTAIEYTFTLPSVPLDATDLLASRMRDLEAVVLNLTAENERLSTANSTLQAKFDELSTQLQSSERVDAISSAVSNLSQLIAKPPVYVRATSTTQVTSGSTLVWANFSGTNAPIVFDKTGEFTFTEQGIFEMTMVLMHLTTSTRTAFELMHGSKSVVGVTINHATNNPAASKMFGGLPTGCEGCSPVPLHYIVEAKKGDQMKLIYRGNQFAEIGSYMTIRMLSSTSAT